MLYLRVDDNNFLVRLIVSVTGKVNARSTIGITLRLKSYGLA